jgi:hypothetical protein
VRFGEGRRSLTLSGGGPLCSYANGELHEELRCMRERMTRSFPQAAAALPRQDRVPRRAAQGEKEIIGDAGGSLDPPGSLLTHLRTVCVACCECLPARLNRHG